MFCKKGVLRKFAKFIGKHLCQSLFFNKVAGLRPVNFAKFLRTPLYIEHLWWLLLRIDGIEEEPGETWEQCETKVQRLLSEELDINDVVIERAHRVKGYSHEKKNSKKF